MNKSSRHSARIAARVARATVRNTGSNSSTATRVAGSEPLKITTPISPLIQPPALLSSVRFCRFEVRSIWLSLIVWLPESHGRVGLSIQSKNCHGYISTCLDRAIKPWLIPSPPTFARGVCHRVRGCQPTASSPPSKAWRWSRPAGCMPNWRAWAWSVVKPGAGHLSGRRRCRQVRAFPSPWWRRG
ncbi:hypothetical protein D3C86_1502900 [compost metagenome]